MEGIPLEPHVTIADVNVSEEMTQTYVLTYQDTGGPSIVAGPYATNITDTTAVIEWQTDEPTNGTVIVDGVSYHDETYRTLHVVAVNELSPSTEYLASVSSYDESGNGPAAGRVTFTTKSTPDTKPPMVIEGPMIHSIDKDRFTVEWVTDEPSQTVLNYGKGSDLSNEATAEEFVTSHSVLLTSLDPETIYSVRAAATDRAGNGPTLSRVATAKTLAEPDAEPPLIISGPVVTDIDHTAATISWESEPAISALSLNDGSSYRVIEGASYITKHSVRVTDLTPSTSYEYIVSATDRAGNGPTLSRPKEFTTTSEPDTDNPVIIKQVRVVGITHQSAVVQWKTDEPADSVVRYGVEGGELDRIATNTQLKTQHIVHLTELDKSTNYVLRVHSKDAAGNEVVSDLVTFKTRNLPDTAKPHFVSPPTVTGVSNNTSTISWETDEPTDAVIEYGVGSTFSHSKSQSKPKTKHTMTLAGLEAGAQYSFSVTATDTSNNSSQYQSSAGNVTQLGEDLASAGGTGFTTGRSNDTTPPAFSSAPTLVWSDSDTAMLSWSNDEPVSVDVSYNRSGNAEVGRIGDIDLDTAHQMVMTNLVGGSSYQYTIRVIDVAGNESTNTGSFNVPTLADSKAPIISSIMMNVVNASSIEVIWNTDEIAGGFVKFGSSSDNITAVALDNDISSGHNVTLVNVPVDATYFEVVVDDVAGNQGRAVLATLEGSLGLGGGFGATGGCLIDPTLLDPSTTRTTDDDSTTNTDTNTNTNTNSISDSNTSSSSNTDNNDGHNGGTTSSTNTTETGNGDESEPTTASITAPANIEISATGALTHVSLGRATAYDSEGNSLIAIPNHGNVFKPGLHHVVWTALDAVGTRFMATQRVIIQPMVNFALNQVVGDNSGVKVAASLNGKAAEYPVEIQFSLSGSLTEGDHFSVHGDELVIVIEEGTDGFVQIDIEADIASAGVAETIQLTMTALDNAAEGRKTSHVIDVVEGNTAPNVFLNVTQAGSRTLTASQMGGLVTVNAAIDDPNQNDEHSLNWSYSDTALSDSDGDAANGSYVFDPSALEAGIYRIEVHVTDNADTPATTKMALMIRVIEQAIQLSSSTDSDGDGIMDADESLEDSDGDRIADYLDNIAAKHLLPVSNDSQDTHLMETEPGLTLILGETAFGAGNHAAEITFADLSAAADPSVGAFDIEPEEILFISAVFDFEATGMPTKDDSVRIVLPLQVQIPAEATYYKYSETHGWYEFYEDSNNGVASAPGADGLCPPVGDNTYANGLAEGHWCVQLTIENGGPNDADGSANGTVVDPGAIGTRASEARSAGSDSETTTGVSDQSESTSTPTTTTNPSSAEVSWSSGGSIGFVWLLLLVIGAYARQINSQTRFHE